MFHVYKEGTFRYDAGYPYIAFIISVSQTWAIYCLVLFYFGLKKLSHDSPGYQLFSQIRPIPKFLCIKGVVFFTYWQSVAIAFAVYFRLIKPTEHWTSNNIATGLQDTIICIEMFIAAIAHIFAFKVSDFAEAGYSPLVPPHKVLFDVANVSDIVNDAQEVLSTTNLRQVGKKTRKHRRKYKNKNKNKNKNTKKKKSLRHHNKIQHNKAHQSDYDFKTKNVNTNDNNNNFNSNSDYSDESSDNDFMFETSSDELSSSEKEIKCSNGNTVNDDCQENKIEIEKQSSINEELVISNRKLKKSRKNNNNNNNKNKNKNKIDKGNKKEDSNGNSRNRGNGSGWQIVTKIKSSDKSTIRKSHIKSITMTEKREETKENTSIDLNLLINTSLTKSTGIDFQSHNQFDSLKNT